QAGRPQPFEQRDVTTDIAEVPALPVDDQPSVHRGSPVRCHLPRRALQCTRIPPDEARSRGKATRIGRDGVTEWRLSKADLPQQRHARAEEEAVVLGPQAYARLDQALTEVDAQLARDYPGESGSRQPV